MTIDEATFVVVDTETSGVDDGSDLLEVAAVIVDPTRGPIAAFETLVRPTKPIPPEAKAVHHLVDDDFAGAPERTEALAALEAWAPADAVFVAHHAEFDQRMLAPALADRPWVCSERLSRHLLPAAPNFKNACLYYVLGGPKLVGNLHRALSDVGVTAYVLSRLLERYRAFAAEQCGGDPVRMREAAQVQKLISFAASPYVIARWPMGPADAKGKPLSEVDTGLLQWALRKADLGADLRWNVERELQRRRGAAA